MDFIKFESREKHNKFLMDPVIKTINEQISKIQAIEIPEQIIIKDGEGVVLYSEKTRKLIDKFTKQRDVYIKRTYWSEDDK